MKTTLSLIVMATLLLIGCAKGIEVGPADEFWDSDKASQRVWPTPPSRARIRYLHSIGSSEDVGFQATALERFFGYIVGKADLGLTRPYGIAVKGRLLAIADPGAAVIHLMDLNGIFHKRMSSIGATGLVSPVGIAIGAGHYFVSDSALNTVFILDQEGKLIRQLEGLMRPTGLAFDPATQRLYVAETLAHRIAVFSVDGNRLFDIERPGGSEQSFNAPTHIAFRDGVLVINDTMNFRIVALDGDGGHMWSFGTHGTGSGHFAQSKGIDIDSRGHVYVADAIFNRVQIFDQQGQFLLAFGGPGHGNGDIWMPGSVFVAGDQIFVADSHNKRVQVFEYVGGE